MSDTDQLKNTPLDALHRELGAKMVPFAGYDMPVQYPAGIMKEHLHTREKASVFDVSHMGQAYVRGADPHSAFEKLVPADIKGLSEGRIRYSMFTDENGGILDDLMITDCGDHLFIVVNAGCKDADFAHIEKQIGNQVDLDILQDQALIALQGPASATVLARLAPGVEDLKFMTTANFVIDGIDCGVSRSGYSGEDGYEISIPADGVEKITRLLLAEDEIEPAGLGARDSLRLEAGLCLYGSDIETSTTPIEAGLIWAIDKRRRETGGFPGADIILGQIKDGASRKRVGILPEGRAPARAHTEITNNRGDIIGEITSGGFGPSAGGPVAMGYVTIENAKIDTPINLMVRGKAMPAKVVKMPIVKQSYYKP